MGNNLPRPHDVPRPQWGNDYVDAILFDPAQNAGLAYSYGQASDFFEYLPVGVGLNVVNIPIAEKISLAPAVPGVVYEVVVGPLALDSYIVPASSVRLTVIATLPDASGFIGVEKEIGQISMPDLEGHTFPAGDPILTHQHYEQQKFTWINPAGAENYMDVVDFRLQLSMLFSPSTDPGGYTHIDFGIPRIVRDYPATGDPGEIGVFGVRAVAEMRNCVYPTVNPI